MKGEALLAAVEQAGLTGRGGAAFSTATKVRAALDQRAELIVNACDGELGAGKDAFVVERHLAQVVHGAGLVGGAGIRFAAHRGTHTEANLLRAGLDVLSVPHRYVSSEESSLVSLANGGLARPLTKQVPVVFGACDANGRKLPETVVLNAETVLRIAQIEQRGPAWFRSFGTFEEPGPRLATIDGAVFAAGIIETAAGVAVEQLIRAAGGATGPVSGVGVGGLSGGWLTPDEAQGAIWSRAGLAAYQISPGPGTVRVLGGDGCPLAHVSDVLQYAAGESAGQCGPCMFGIPALAEDMRLLRQCSLDRVGGQRLGRRLELLPGRGACRFPDGVAGYARSALRAFAGEVSSHLAGTCTTDAASRSSHVVCI
ncbi:MAG TPA: NADH-ubiquinone oxidoreductase-F iron-sulfur binding region domain-containing protein [Dermatophilaceae bacterium]|nr:NADH-ubiquinone oxidoreductase-F iron-sulfur binding region domain-containing protein [Dermatophilaceae bacterium]